MAFFIVTMTHPDGGSWGHHVIAHVDYLRRLIDAGKVRASGPVEGFGCRAGFLIMTVADRAEAEALIAADPFAIEGLIDTLTILEWNPLSGAFAAEAAPYRPA